MSKDLRIAIDELREAALEVGRAEARLSVLTELERKIEERIKEKDEKRYRIVSSRKYINDIST